SFVSNVFVRSERGLDYRDAGQVLATETRHHLIVLGATCPSFTVGCWRGLRPFTPRISTADDCALGAGVGRTVVAAGRDGDRMGMAHRVVVGGCVPDAVTACLERFAEAGRAVFDMDVPCCGIDAPTGRADGVLQVGAVTQER